MINIYRIVMYGRECTPNIYYEPAFSAADAISQFNVNHKIKRIYDIKPHICGDLCEKVTDEVTKHREKQD